VFGIYIIEVYLYQVIIVHVLLINTKCNPPYTNKLSFKIYCEIIISMHLD